MEIKVEKVVVNLKTGERTELFATVTQKPDENHQTYSLTYEGYRSEWKANG